MTFWIFRSEAGSPTPRKGRRGDIHSRAPPSSPSAARNAHEMRPAPSSAHQNGNPSSTASGPVNSVVAPTSDVDGNEPIIVVWGTMIELQSCLNAFKRFLRDFKVKYRHQFDSERVAQKGGRRDGIEVAYGKEDGEMLLYESYLRRMKLSNQTNLNLDLLDLLAFPPTKNLYRQLLSYPHELIPVLDQALKDEIITLAEEDFSIGTTTEDVIETMESAIYKVRPFGGEKSINMRELNPQGPYSLSLTHKIY